MKKQVLMAIALASVTSAFAQNKLSTPSVASYANKVVVTNKQNFKDDVGFPVQKTNKTTVTGVVTHNAATHKNGGGNNVNSANEAVVGNTDYDLQTNSSSYPRLTKNSDGTMSSMWTFVPDGGTSGNDRGTGYNYYDGTAWAAFPTARIEGTDRTGFVNCVVTGSGQEASFGHSSTSFSVLYTHRATKGTGTWIKDPNALKTGGANNTDTWARVVSGGTNGQSIHCIVNDNVLPNNAGGTLVYSRSQDDGATWNIVRDTIPGSGAVDFPAGLGGDAYFIATKGNTVAVVLGDITTDIFLYKSTDDGTTWTKTQITNTFPGGSYDPDGHITDFTTPGVADTVLTCGGDVNVTIDNNGTCHVFWGLMRMMDDSAAVGYTNFSVFLGTNGIAYWHEGMNQAVIAAQAEDWNGDGVLNTPVVPDPNWTDPNELSWGRYGNMGLACIPSATIDASGNIYLAYQALDESADTTYYFKSHYQVYVTTSSDGGTTWTSPYNVVTLGGAGPSDSLSYEACYPSIATNIDGEIHLEYQRDYFPGVYAGGTGTSYDVINNDPANNLNDIVVVNIPVTDPGILGIHELGGASAASFQVSQNTPNPFSGTSTFTVSLKTSADVTVDIVNAIGQTMKSDKYDHFSAGTHTLTIDATKLGAGVYYYSVKVGAEKVTNKMIVK